MLNWEVIVTTALLLFLASGIAGLMTGLFLRVWALVLVSPVTAILAAIVLQSTGFGFWIGIPIMVGCLVLGQVAYLAAAFYRQRGGLSVQDDVDGQPGEHR
jgi:hypothetical protein